MRIIGVDPGTVVMGYGIVEAMGESVTTVAFGALEAPRAQNMALRLRFLHLELAALIERYRPQVMAIEAPFMGDNARSALAVGKAQAVAMLAAALKDIPVFEYSPARIKYHVAGDGASSKEGVQQMVKILLGLDALPQPTDAADGLAVAICHLREDHLNNILLAES